MISDSDRIEREKNKKRYKRLAMIDKVKGWIGWFVAGIFWIVMAYTFLGGCIGTFIKSSDDPQDDYEEYVHDNIP